MRRHGFPANLTSLPRGDVAPLNAADTLSQLVAVASVGGSFAQEAADGAYAFALSLGYSGPPLRVGAEGFTGEQAGVILERLTHGLASKLDPVVLAGGTCRPALPPPTLDDVTRAVPFLSVAPAQFRRANVMREPGTRASAN